MASVSASLSSEQYDRSYGDRALIRRIVRCFAGERKRMALVAALILLHSLLGTAIPMLIAQSIDVAASSPTPGAVLALFPAAGLGAGDEQSRVPASDQGV